PSSGSSPPTTGAAGIAAGPGTPSTRGGKRSTGIRAWAGTLRRRDRVAPAGGARVTWPRMACMLRRSTVGIVRRGMSAARSGAMSTAITGTITVAPDAVDSFSEHRTPAACRGRFALGYAIREHGCPLVTYEGGADGD